MRGYHQTSTLPLPALLSIDDSTSSSPLGFTQKHLSSVLTIAVLMREVVRTVQKLYSEDMQTLATFACNDGVSSRDTHSAYQSVDSDLGALYHASVCVPCHTRCVRPALPILQMPFNSLYSVLTS
jgi:hypothetical protein